MGLFGVSIGEMGFKALASSALKKAGSGIGGLFKWLGSLDALHIILLALVIFGAWQTFGRWSQHRHTANVEAQLSATIGQLTTASNALTDAREQLAISQANEAALTKAIGDQNAAIADLGAKSAQQQAAAAKAVLNAQGRASDAENTAERLRAAARAGGPSSAATAANCEPLQSVKDQWGAK